VDGTFNKQGTIKDYVKLSLKIGDRIWKMNLLVSGLGNQKIILGYPWLQRENPDINWRTAKIKWQTPDITKL